MDDGKPTDPEGRDEDELEDEPDDQPDDEPDDEPEDEADDELEDEPDEESDEDGFEDELNDETDDEVDDGESEDDESDDDEVDADVAEPAEDDTDFATVATGGSIEEAKRNALDQLRKVVPYVNEADVEFEVVDEGSRGGFLGRGKTQPRVEARLRPASERVDGDLAPAAGVLREFLEQVIARMGLEAAIETDETDEVVTAEISGDDLGILIGRHGQTIDALQYLAAIVVNGDRRSRRQVIVDAEGYRKRREVSLKALADRTVQKVLRESAQITLKPMTAAERKVIHLHLKDHPKVETVSEGQEPYRAVIISPKRRHS